MVKAIGLLSGGLDSTLAVRMMLEQGVDVIALNFVTPFCTCTRKGCQNQAQSIAHEFGVELKIIGLKEEYIDLVRNPKHGFGKNMNPCIDCRIFMVSKAREYMQETGCSFVFTGEVLGQRPMSQHRNAMKKIERESGLEGRIVRPLCARFLEPTIPEIEGAIDRKRLLAISGRSRKSQLSLLREFSMTDNFCPAGGCRLTDPNYAKKLRESFEHGEDSLEDIHLLKYGRHFRLLSGAKVIVGRDERENNILKAYADRIDTVLEVVDYPGPIVLLMKSTEESDIKIAAELCVAYSDYEGSEPTKVMCGNREVLAMKVAKESLTRLRIN